MPPILPLLPPSPSHMASHSAAARASLSLGMPYSGIPNSLASRVVVHEGWVLKKRRKRMQGHFLHTPDRGTAHSDIGFARRYFTLYQSGLLSYSFEPGQPTRDQISLHHAAISTAPGRKDIHLDSNTATFHIKCLNTDDFNQWMAAFRSTFLTNIRSIVLNCSSPGDSLSQVQKFVNQIA